MALSERAARERAALALVRLSRAAMPSLADRPFLQDLVAADAAAPLSPWLQPRLVEIIETPAVTATSLARTLDGGTVLVPRDPASPVAEYQVLGPAESAAPAAPVPPAATGAAAAKKAKPCRRRPAAKPVAAAGTGRPKAAKPAAPARRRAKPGQQSSTRSAPAKKVSAKPAAKRAKATASRASSQGQRSRTTASAAGKRAKERTAAVATRPRGTTPRKRGAASAPRRSR